MRDQETKDTTDGCCFWQQSINGGYNKKTVTSLEIKYWWQIVHQHHERPETKDTTDGCCFWQQSINGGYKIKTVTSLEIKYVWEIVHQHHERLASTV